MSGEPLYQQLARLLRDQITSGKIKPRTPCPAPKHWPNSTRSPSAPSYAPSTCYAPRDSSGRSPDAGGMGDRARTACQLTRAADTDEDPLCTRCLARSSTAVICQQIRDACPPADVRQV